MKTKTLWFIALGLGAVCVWTGWNFVQETKPQLIIGIQKSAIVLAHSQSPTLYWGDLDLFGDLALKLKNDLKQNLAEGTIGEAARYIDQSYSQLQPGFFLVTLGNQRMFVFTDPFLPEDLDPTLALEFSSDWTVLQRSSLLPESWPEPRMGWIVLGSQISESLMKKSLNRQKPVVIPVSEGTLWLLKTPETEWTIQKP
ncbi:hypothetical protein GW756_01085 [bacterium]|nr:hypothetical protein [bacterium]NCQ54950.1 hypothetical protein [Candidatus Parcubacteria bacterium]NCS66994.1 hypothetical protein [Candidatus Peregrinibacteria bacterium]NCS95940.1 hypothetical protein [bacterium]